MNALYWIIAVLVVMWGLGFALHVGGALIHFLLAIAVLIFLIDLLRRTA